ITVDFSKSTTNAKSAEVQTSKMPSPIERGAGQNFRRVFSPPMERPRVDTFSLLIPHKIRYEDIIFNPEDMFRVYSASERTGEAIIIALSP
ncbi:hypothetical protein P692DRAFT_20762053, partial [Suillus brevipes Sb2]